VLLAVELAVWEEATRSSRNQINQSVWSLGRWFILYEADQALLSFLYLSFVLFFFPFFVIAKWIRISLVQLLGSLFL